MPCSLEAKSFSLVLPAGLSTDLSKSKKVSASKVIFSDDGTTATAATGATAGVAVSAVGPGAVSTYGAGAGAGSGVTKGIAAFLSMPSQPSTASAGVQKPVCQQRPKLLLTTPF